MAISHKGMAKKYLQPQTNEPPMLTPTSLRDEEDETSLLTYVTNEMQAAIKRIPDNIFNLSEKQLQAKMEPDSLLCRLRLSFWDEYQRVLVQGGPIMVEHVCHGNCTKEFFYREILTDPLQLMWIITVPKDYYLSMREMLDKGLDRLREIIMQPFVVEKIVKLRNADGKLEDKVINVVDTKIMSEIRAAIAMIDQRVKGAVIQKLQVQQRSVNVNVDGADAAALGFGEMTLEQLDAIDKKIQGIKAKVTEAESLPEPAEIIDVES